VLFVTFQANQFRSTAARWMSQSAPLLFWTIKMNERSEG